MQFAENGGTLVQKAQILSIQSTRDGWFPRRKTVARLLGVTASLLVCADGCPVVADAAWPRPRRADASWMRAAWATPRQVGPPSRGSRRAALSRRRAVGRGTAPAAHRAEAVVEPRRVAHGRRSRARGRAQATWDLADRGRGHVKAAPSCEIVGRRTRVEGHRGRASRSRADRLRSRRKVA